MKRSLPLALVLACACVALNACGASDAGEPAGAGDVAAGEQDGTSSGGGDVQDDDATPGTSDESDAGPDLDTGGVDGPGDTVAEKDLEYVHDIAEWLDLSYLFDSDDDDDDDAGGGPEQDGSSAAGGAGGDEPDASGDGAPADDVAAEQDTWAGDAAATGEDTGPGDPASDAAGAEDTGAEDTTGYDTFFDECEELGIPSNWEGTFTGDIAYDIDSGGLVSPEEGLLAVAGELTFSIECIESKLVVEGELSGAANVEGQGDFPYSFNLLGFYNPLTGELTADLTDGVALVYDLVEIYFLGSFNGQLNEDESFDGVWTGEAQGTNLPFITGVADGDGVWTATAVE